jgi:hypothetical protein
MSTVNGGPNTATSISNGLVFCLDAANQNSYAGYPTFSLNYYYGNLTGSYFYDLSGNGNQFAVISRDTFPPYNNVMPILANNYLTFNGSNQMVGLTTTTPNSFDLRYNRTWDALVYLASDWDTHTVASGSGHAYVQGIGYDNQFAVQVVGNNTPSNNRKVRIFTSDYTTCPYPTYNQCGGYFNEWNMYSTASLSAGTWNHICTVLSNQTMSIYINGTLDSSVPYTARILDKGGEAYAMANPNTIGPGFFKGRLSLMRMYNRSLSAAEVYQNYINVKGRMT